MPPRANRKNLRTSPSARPSRRFPFPPIALPRIRLPRISRRQLLTTGLVAAGALGTTGLIDLIWPVDNPLPEAEATSLSAVAKPANRAVTVLLIGLDSDRISDVGNQAAPAGAANADALMLLRINPEGPVQVLQIPATLAVQLPGEKKPRSLGSLYRSGGPALTADAVRDLAGLPRGKPDRYLVISRYGLRLLAERLGGVEANPNRTMRHTDNSQKLKIDLQSGLQRLNASQIEHLARWRDPKKPLETRLSNLQEVARSLHRELELRQGQVPLPDLVAGLQGQVQTNLSRTETLSLLVTALQPDIEVQFTTLPLAPPRRGDGAAAASALRERVRDLPKPFWIEPKPAAKPSKA
jgi:polyisoprenyl-teichoic acid--peptidoglycan teichoic acid transferase